MCDIVSHHWAVSFDILNPMISLPRILNIHESSIYSSEYQWNADLHREMKQQDRALFQLTLSGTGAFQEGGREHLLTAGDGFLINLGDRNYRYFQPEGCDSSQRVLWCNLESPVVREMISEINKRYGYLYRLPLSSGIIQRLLEYRNSSSAHITMNSSENAGLATELLYALIWSKESENHSSSEEIILEKALNLINSRKERLFSAEELAETLSLSREHLSRIFRKAFGCGPYRFMLLKKIEAADFMLQHGSLPIGRIGYDLGFTSPMHFSGVYKKLKGITPGEFRRIQRSNLIKGNL